MKERNPNCTYTPVLTNYRGQQEANFSRFGRQGMVEYFERVAGNRRCGREAGKSSRVTTEGDSGRNKENSRREVNRSGEQQQQQCRGRKQSYE